MQNKDLTNNFGTKFVWGAVQNALSQSVNQIQATPKGH